MKIREANTQDALQVAEVQRRSWAHVYSEKLLNPLLAELSLETHQWLWQQRIFAADSKLWVIEDNCLCGFLWLGLGEHSELSALYLSPEVIGKGYGRALHDHVIAYIKKLGIQQLHLWVMQDNQHAQAFYQHLGWQLSDEYRETKLAENLFIQQKAWLQL